MEVQRKELIHRLTRVTGYQTSKARLLRIQSHWSPVFNAECLSEGIGYPHAMDLDQCEFGSHAVDISVIKKLAEQSESNDSYLPLTVPTAAAHRLLGMVVSKGAQDAPTGIAQSPTLPATS